jgi:PhnB protein
VPGPAAEFHNGLSRGSAPGRAFGDPVADPGSAVVKVIEVEATNDRSFAVDEHEEDADTSVLLVKQRLVMFSKIRVELVAAVGQRPREVGAILVLELEHRVQMSAGQALKLGHAPKVSGNSERAAQTSALSPVERSGQGLPLAVAGSAGQESRSEVPRSLEATTVGSRPMAGLTPYIHFPGTARAALSFYAQVFGGTAELHTFAEFSRSDGPADAIAHGLLLDAPVALYGADVAGDEPVFRAQGLMLSLLGTADPETLRTWFNRLAEGGTVVDDLKQRPWGAFDGQVIDRYDLHWLIGFETDPDA